MGCLLNNHTGDFSVFFLHQFTVSFPKTVPETPYLGVCIQTTHFTYSLGGIEITQLSACFYPHGPQYDFGVASYHFCSILTSMLTLMTPIRMSQPECLSLQREKQCACSQMVRNSNIQLEPQPKPNGTIKIQLIFNQDRKKEQLHALCLFPWRPINLNGINEYICDIFICSSQAW